MSVKTGRKILSICTAVALCAVASTAWADDVDDVLAFLDKYAELENNLEAQADMIHDDRVMIAGRARQTNQKENMAIQMAQRDANAATGGGAARLVVRVEAPEARVYGDTAVVSFMRLTNVFPANAAPINPGPLWVSLMLVKERGNWKIVHTHISPIAPNN